MWLQYGLDANDFLVSIEYVPRGKTDLQCPYCRGALTAKKGDILQHHFAHTGETCRSAARGEADLPTLPLYDKFDLHLSGKDLAKLTELWEKSNHGEKAIWFLDPPDYIKRFRKKWLLKKSGAAAPVTELGHRFTELGQIPFGGLRLKEFEAIQAGSISTKLHRLTEHVKKSFQHGFIDLPEALTDLKIYLAQMRRSLLLTLYFLEVQVDGQTFYKIGVTRREMGDRLAEIEADLRQYFQTVKLKVKGTWQHRGNLELYFKHRYKRFQHPIANLTEYYQFDPDQIKDVLKDLKRLKPKVLSDLDLDKVIFEGKPLLIERQIEAERQAYFDQERERQRSQSIRTGMKRAKKWGKHVGRPVGAEEPSEQFLAKPSSQRVLQVLEKGLSLRQTAAEAGVSVNTVRKVKAIIDEH